MEEFSCIIDELSDDIRGRSNTTVGGDFNSWAQDWGSPSTNARGRTILEAFATLDIALLNEGTQQTFNRAGAGSIIDLTYANSALACQASWRISEIYTASNHEAIVVSLGENPPRRTVTPSANKAYRQDTLNPHAFSSALAGLATGDTDSANDAALKLAVAVDRACNASMQQLKTFRKHHKPVYWWNDDIATLRSSCLRARRLVQRARGSPNLLARSEAYKSARSALKNAIRTSKRECFLKLCDDVEKDPWGGAYKKVVKRVNAGSNAPSDPEALEGIVRVLLPTGQPLYYPVSSDSLEICPVSEQEILESARTLNNKKAPGLDSIPNRATKMLLSLHPKVIVETFNKCLSEGTFVVQTHLSAGNDRESLREGYRCEARGCNRARWWTLEKPVRLPETEIDSGRHRRQAQDGKTALRSTA
ncbi:uncharacterized protein [Drosophila kikkawai]|uniref:Endonuclease/exonuclease/phosphatase domain-containing protein n=1 Tax=Drosophila kikkawai TaxID=30033 RepID=A0ABM3C8G5_DROKI|nr:uncharacterized protein LOC121503181 [Drosophila kikkawai]